MYETIVRIHTLGYLYATTGKFHAIYKATHIRAYTTTTGGNEICIGVKVKGK
jgi:hypothetical protein